MYTRKEKKHLDHEDILKLEDAERLAKTLNKELNTFVSINPKFLRDYPDDLGKWVQSLLNRVRIWCTRAGVVYFCLWVRENYKGDREEHVHILLSIPPSKRLALALALRKWLPGDDRVVDVRRTREKTDRFGRKTTALTYMLKQMSNQARYSRWKRGKSGFREKKPFAPVLGKRCGVSRSLSAASQLGFSGPIVFADRCKSQ